MPRTIKNITDEKGLEIEVYADNCKECGLEMIFPKAEADRIDELFPFIKEKIANGTSCMKCAQEKEKNDSSFLFTEEEKTRIKDILLKNL